jgi:8-oxo-dGTP diphosphatase
VTRYQDIDWVTWTPNQRATLLFVVRDGQILLIRKKRGLGAGKINGPGGRIEGDETPLQCAIREVQEELCITPTEVEPCGELMFQFVDGLALHGYVFIANAFTGEPTETDEAAPIWTPLDAIPYADMWQDDRLWLPLMLKRERFVGRFLFDGDQMLGHEILTGEMATPTSD